MSGNEHKKCLKRIVSKNRKRITNEKIFTQDIYTVIKQVSEFIARIKSRFGGVGPKTGDCSTYLRKGCPKIGQCIKY